MPPPQRAAWRSRLPARLGDRSLAVVATILLELLLLAGLVTMSLYEPEREEVDLVRLTTFDSSDADDTPENEPEEQDDRSAAAEAVPLQADAPPPVELERVLLPRPLVTPAPVVTPQPSPQPTRTTSPPESSIRAVIRDDGPSGPPAPGNRGNGTDSPVVGTAPDGSPLYGARWFREPTRQEMAGYLSTVEPPAWALIACRTAPRWEVVDCEPIEQYPPNSNIMNAVLASTWQYQVRPPRRGNQSLVGAWVRIRISYSRGGPQAGY